MSVALPARGVSQREGIRGLSISRLLESREVSQRSSLSLPQFPVLPLGDLILSFYPNFYDMLMPLIYIHSVKDKYFLFVSELVIILTTLTTLWHLPL